jgi:DNA repair exonuclease SbcCD ATPase subunit
LEAQAKELETAAEAHRKAAKEPPPGKRLDDLEGYTARCEKRLAAKKTAREEAEKALEDARAEEAEAEKELTDAKDKLSKLQAELGAAKRDGDDAMQDVPAERLQQQEEELERLRAQLQRTEAERDEALAAAQPTPTAPLNTQGELATLEELEAKLKRLLEQYQKDTQGNPETALARVRELADLADRVERAKRQRTGSNG